MILLESVSCCGAGCLLLLLHTIELRAGCWLQSAGRYCNTIAIIAANKKRTHTQSSADNDVTKIASRVCPFA